MSQHAGLFLSATALLLLAHALRAMRWSMLLPRGYVSRRFNLLIGLALGYIVNTFLPLRVGELLRVAWVSGREKVQFTRVAASVATERLADVIAVSMIAAAITAWSGGRLDLSQLARFFAVVAAALVGVAMLIRGVPAVRSALWRLFSVFNPALRMGLAEFAWNFSELVTTGALVRPRFVWMSVAMWCTYLLSYLLLSGAVEAPVDDTLQALLGSPLQATWAAALPDNWAALMVFTSLPVLGIVAYGLLSQWSGVTAAMAAWLRNRGTEAPDTRSSRQKFKYDSEFDTFLTSLFSGDRLVVRQFGLKGVEDAVVHKLFQGGSEAITALVESREGLVIRKFAAGPAGSKLKVQRQWLASHRNGVLPLVDILMSRQGDDFFQYDMPAVPGAGDFLDVIHTSRLETSVRTLEDLLERVERFHRLNSTGATSPECIRAYLEHKTIANATQILRFVLAAFPHREYEINGVAYRIDDWRKLTDLEWLQAQVRSREASTIHGDLTIENIIASPRHGARFYLIDPNPDNIFDSPLIDYAKLMQSLHLGYEALCRGPAARVNGSRITLPFTRSHQYTELHRCLERFIAGRWGESVLREVYFHEIVNYLRLTPYKLRRDPQRFGMTFFASTSFLLGRYLEAGS